MVDFRFLINSDLPEGLNVNTKFKTPTTIPSGMLINEDGTAHCTDGQTDIHTEVHIQVVPT